MFRHVVMWSFREGFDEAENEANAMEVKRALEGLPHIIPEIKEIKVYINKLKYSTKDVMLDSLFADEAAFLTYMEHPAHKTAGQIVTKFLDRREAFDFWE